NGSAVTFPGGAVYIDRSLAELTSDENELAALLAHEIAHAAARHVTAQLSRQLLVQAPTAIAAALPTNQGWKDEWARLGISLAPRTFLQYSHDQEWEANTIAVQILVKSGYSPQALSAILEKINAPQSSEKTLLTYAYNHPQGQEAARRLEADLEKQKLS